MPPQTPRAALVRTAIVGLAAVVAGLGSYVLLIFAAPPRISVADYSNFAVFWSLAVTIGLGFFYPLEQETSRSIAGSTPGLNEAGKRGGLVRFVVTCSVIVAVVLSLAALLLFTPAGIAYIGEPALILALVASFFGFALQFPARGLMSGSRATTTYSAIIAVEGALRVLLPALILVAGLASALSFALVVPLAAAASILPVVLRRDRSWRGLEHIRAGMFVGQFARLIVAALSIQLILNSGTLIAKFVAGPENLALTGQILVCLSIARIPVFGYQVLQILYLPRLAGEWKSGDRPGARRTLTVAIGAAVAIGAVVVVGMVLAGPFVIGLLFGQALVLDTAGIALVSTGVAVFLVALVSSDGAIALGRHTLVTRSWVVAVVGALVPVLLITDPLQRVTSPLIVGSVIAVVQLVIGLLRAVRRGPAVHDLQER